MLVFESALIKPTQNRTKWKVCLFLKREAEASGERLVLYQVGFYPEQKRLSPRDQKFETRKPHNCRKFEVKCPGNGNISLWFEAEEKLVKSLSNDVIHSEIDGISSAYFGSKSWRNFQLLQFSFSMPWTKLVLTGLRAATSGSMSFKTKTHLF